MPLPTKLPGSDQEVSSLLFVAFIAGLAAFARVIYGREEVKWRLMVASIIVAMTTSVLIYGASATYFGAIGGHMSAAIGAGVGLFTDDVLKRAKEYISTKRFPGEPPAK